MLLTLIAVALAADPPLAGKWEGGLFIITLEANGTGTMSDGPGVPPEAIKWKATDKTLAITQDGETTTYKLKLGKDQITLSGGDIDEPVTLTRKGAKAAAATKAPPLSAKGTCEGACNYYLQCGGFGPAYKQPCLAECAGSGLTPYQLAVFQTLDCREAIAVVAAAEIAAWQQQLAAASQQAQKNNSSECNGCKRWGDDCMWASESNWGKGPYSGAVSSCDPSCCR